MAKQLILNEIFEENIYIYLYYFCFVILESNVSYLR